MIVKLADFLAQESVELTHGTILKAITRSEGYVPSRGDTDAIHLGKYNYIVLGVGNPDETGKYASYQIVPIVMNEEGTAYENAEEDPIIVIEEGKVTYMSGRNHPGFKDGYHTRQYHVAEGLAPGEEHRTALVTFINFANSEFSLGVNDFQIDIPEIEQ